MFNIFREKEKIKHPQLQDTIGELRVQAAIEGLTFTVCANHVSAQVSELPDKHSIRKLVAETAQHIRSGTGANARASTCRMIGKRFKDTR